MLLLSIQAAISATEIKYGLPPGLMLAIQQVESNGDPKAHVRHDGKSNKASYGLFQLQLSTARFMGFKGKPSDLFKPTINIEFAGRYLHWLFENVTNGNPARTLRCYNAGPHSKICKKDLGYVDKILNVYLNNLSTQPAVLSNNTQAVGEEK